MDGGNRCPDRSAGRAAKLSVPFGAGAAWRIVMRPAYDVFTRDFSELKD